MSVVASDQGVILLTSRLLGQVPIDGLVVRLFRNNLGPTDVTPLSAFNELPYPDYAPKVITPSHWHGGGSSGTSSYTYPTVTWEFAPYAGPADTLYGYFVTDVARTLWYWCEQILTPAPIPNTGAVIQLNLVVQLRNP